MNPAPLNIDWRADRCSGSPTRVASPAAASGRPCPAPGVRPSGSPEREALRTASRRPSGDQARPSTPRGRSVRRRASPGPSSGSRWTWTPSSRRRAHPAAPRRPAVDRTGTRASDHRARTAAHGPASAPIVRRRAGAEPSAGTIQIDPAIAVLRRGDGLEGEHDLVAGGRQPGVGRDAEGVEVVRARGPRCPFGHRGSLTATIARR